MQGKPYAGNPHIRFEEGAGVTRCPGRPALLYKKLLITAFVAAMFAPLASSAYDKYIVSGDPVAAAAEAASHCGYSEGGSLSARLAACLESIGGYLYSTRFFGFTIFIK